jgi:hypothetical protein
MEIKLNTQVDPLPRTAAGRVRGREVPAAPGDAEFNQSRALEDRLKSVPDIRADKVAEATRLLSDGSYPPPVTISKIAAILAAQSGKGE